jgi:oligoribonuclease
MDEGLVWIDLEMTGLTTSEDEIIEIAMLLTDGNLSNQVVGPCLVINQPKELLDTMDEWCTNTHTASGLVAKVLQSKVSISQAEEQVMEFLQKHTRKSKCILAGNSVHVHTSDIRLTASSCAKACLG